MPKRSAKADGPEAKQAKTAQVALGDQLPALAPLSDSDGNQVDLSALAQETGLVLFFYPKANTGGCTKQAKLFSDNVDAFTAAGYKVFGADLSSAKVISNWKAKQEYKLTLLQGTPEFLGTFGALKGGKSISRSHVVVEKGGKISLLDIGVKPASVPDVLKTVQGNPGTSGGVATEAQNGAKAAAEAAPVPAEAAEPGAKMDVDPPAGEGAAAAEAPKGAPEGEAGKEAAAAVIGDPTVQVADVTDPSPAPVIPPATEGAGAEAVKEPEPAQELAAAAKAEGAGPAA